MDSGRLSCSYMHLAPSLGYLTSWHNTEALVSTITTTLSCQRKLDLPDCSALQRTTSFEMSLHSAFTPQHRHNIRHSTNIAYTYNKHTFDNMAEQIKTFLTVCYVTMLDKVLKECGGVLCLELSKFNKISTVFFTAISLHFCPATIAQDREASTCKKSSSLAGLLTHSNPP
jgi:hypothetical protein